MTKMNALLVACSLLTSLPAATTRALAEHVPVLNEDAKLLASDGQPDDRFGETVDVEGRALVVSAPRNEGVAADSGSLYVFEQDDSGAWLQVAKLAASDGEADDRFGRAKIAGDTIVAGAWAEDELGDRAGAAYVFERDEAGQWLEVAKLLASDGDVLDTFGESVAIDGATIVVGAEHDDDLGDGAGAAYVFEPDRAGQWVERVKLLASDGEAHDALGCTVSISGDRIAVGARGDGDQGLAAGAVYLFERTEAGPWVEMAKLVASDGGDLDLFGAPVVIDGDIVVAGSKGDDDQGFQAGAAYVFERQEDGSWLETAKLFSPHPNVRDSFGTVGISGETIVVGAPDGESRPGILSGTADLFRRDDTGAWVNVARLLPSDAAPLDLFGRAVAIDGGTVVVGARFDDDLGDASGSAYVFTIEDCLLAVELSPRAVPAGSPLRVRLLLEHNRPETVTVPFRLWVEDASGAVIASRTTEPITFHHGDTLHRELTLPIPADAPPGEYRLLVGVERMAQGLVARVERFRVVGAGTVAPVTSVP